MTIQSGSRSGADSAAGAAGATSSADGALGRISFGCIRGDATDLAAGAGVAIEPGDGEAIPCGCAGGEAMNLATGAGAPTEPGGGGAAPFACAGVGNPAPCGSAGVGTADKFEITGTAFVSETGADAASGTTDATEPIAGNAGCSRCIGGAATEGAGATTVVSASTSEVGFAPEAPGSAELSNRESCRLTLLASA